MNDFILENLKKLKEKKIPNPEIDLRVLLNYCKLYNKEIILSNFSLEDINIEIFKSIFKRRLNNEPISKIINKKYFWKDDFFVNQFVLDPRPETELIIEESKNIYKNLKQNLKILDIGTGSGAIAISLAKEYLNSKILAIDISNQAIKVAKINIDKKKLENRIKVKKTTIDNIKDQFDLIVSNPPYLTRKEITNLAIEIKHFEPIIALDGGLDGLNFYRDFAKKIPNLMKPNGYFIVEIGDNQFNECKDIFSKSLLKFKKKSLDLQKKDRIMVFSKI